MADKNIKVSIVVPVYNVEKYLRKCLESLAQQTLSEIEIIVVNDGTKDNSQCIIDEFVRQYPNRFISLIKENGGLSDARNYGIPHCRGEYIGFVDSDDYVDKSMYEEMYIKAKTTDADMVVCDYLKEYSQRIEQVHARRYTSPKDMFIGGLAAAWNKIYKRSVVEKTGIVFPKGLLYEDTEFFCKLIPHISVCEYVDKPFVHYVQREGSIANTQGKKIAMIFDIFDNIFRYYKQNGFLDEYRNELTYFTSRVLLGSSMERICRCKDKQIAKELAMRTVDYLDSNLKGWRKNRYISGFGDKRNIYMRSVYKWNIGVIVALLRMRFSKEDKDLL